MVDKTILGLGDRPIIGELANKYAQTPGINRDIFNLHFPEGWNNTLNDNLIKGTNMKKITVEVFNKSRNELPKYATDFSAGLDLMADVDGDSRILIYPGERQLIPTGLYVAIPEGYELQIRPRSGLALKKGIGVLNSPGTIDSDYRGEVGVILLNTGAEAIRIANGERIAQAVLCEVPQIEWSKVEKLIDLPSTERGAGGFGSTGIDIKSKPIGENGMNNPLSTFNLIENPDIELPKQDNSLKNSDPTKLTE